MTDILDTIDQALGCQKCGESLDDSPSDMYCSEDCSEEAADEIAEREVGNSWASLDWSIDDAPEGPFSWLPAPTRTWRLPRSTGDLDADVAQWKYACSIATTDWQRNACEMRWDDLSGRLNERARERSRHLATAATMEFARLNDVTAWDAIFSVTELTDLEISQFVEFVAESPSPSGYARSEFDGGIAGAGSFVLRGRYVPPPRIVLDFEGLELTAEEARETSRACGHFQVGQRVTIARRNNSGPEPTDVEVGTWRITGSTQTDYTITYIGERVCAP